MDYVTLWQYWQCIGSQYRLACFSPHPLLNMVYTYQTSASFWQIQIGFPLLSTGGSDFFHPNLADLQGVYGEDLFYF